LFKFRYAKKLDFLLIFIGSIGSLGAGAALPLSLQLFGGVIDTFSDFNIQTLCNNKT
jgi:hypothetical protein